MKSVPAPDNSNPNESPARAADDRPCVACTHVRPVAACRYCEGETPRTGPAFAPFDLVRGFRMFWQGAFSVVNEKEYLGRILAVILLAILLFIGLFWLMASIFLPAFRETVTWLPTLLTDAIPIILTVLAAFFLFPVVITVFLFPVLDPLARIAERQRLGYEAAEHPRGPIADFWDSLDTAARILLMQLIAFVICIPLGATFIGAPIAVAIAAFFSGFSWLDYPASRHQLTFPDKLRLARRHWALMTGFGAGFLLSLLIPFFNVCLSAPAGAVGSADLWLRLDKRGTRALPTPPDEA